MVLGRPGPRLDRSLADTDPEVFDAISAELTRQQTTLEMIASENFALVAVVQAQGSVLTNEYAEGYPDRRYYGGCEDVDVVEQLAIDRLKALFGAECATMQPHSGAQANAAATSALLQPGTTILGLDLAHGGHLTHRHGARTRLTIDDGRSIVLGHEPVFVGGRRRGYVTSGVRAHRRPAVRLCHG